MLRRIITEEIAGFMVGITELAAAVFYENDRAAAFKELNDKMIWHHFAEKYEEKRNLPKEEILQQIGAMLEREAPIAGRIGSLDDKDIEFVLEIIRRLGKKYNWNYSVSFERFYTSTVCRMMSGAKIGFSALGTDEIIELFDRSTAEQTR